MKFLALVELVVKAAAIVKSLLNLVPRVRGSSQPFECDADRTLVNLCIDFEKYVLERKELKLCELRQWQVAEGAKGRRITSSRLAKQDRALQKQMNIEISTREQKLEFDIRKLLIERGRYGKSTSWSDFKITYASRFDVLKAIEIGSRG